MGATSDDPQDWYCKHGYYQGTDCPDCDVPSYLPSVMDSSQEKGRLFASAGDLAAITHPDNGAPMQTRHAWIDKYQAMQVGETKRLINAFGDVSTITRVADGWTLSH